MVSTSTLPTSNDQEFGYGQLFQILLRRWPWLLGSLAVAIAGAIYLFTREDPTYESTMQLIVEPNFEQDLRARDLGVLSESQVNEIDYATQLTLMRSSQFLEETINRLKVDYPDLDLENVREEFNLQQIEASDTFTRIFEASYVDTDPIKVQRFLDTLKTVYLEYNQEQQENRLTRGLAHVNRQLDNTRSNLEAAQNELENFRQNQNLLDPNLQGQAVVEALNRVQEEQRGLLTDLNEVERQYQALERRLALSPQTALIASRLSQSTRVQALLDEIQETSLELADQRIIFTDEEPSVQVLTSQRNNQLTQLREEISSVIRQPSAQLDATLQSYLQLGPVDLTLATDLISADVSLQTIESRLETLIEIETSLREEINLYPSLMAEYDRLQPSVEIEQNTLEELLIQRERLSSELARGGFLWEVVEPPQLGEKIGPDLVQFLALGAIVGLFMGGALAFSREGLDQRLHTSDALRSRVPLPLLGVLPWQPMRRGMTLPTWRREHNSTSLHPELSDSDLMQTVLSTQGREALDLIANNLQLIAREQAPQAIAVTSGLPEEGKTTLTLGLAVSLARMNQKVLVIDADLRRSGIQAELQISSRAGLSTLLASRDSHGRPHRFDLGSVHLDVLPSGPYPDDPISLLSSPKFSRLISRCKKHYDLILVDTPPVLGMADAIKVGAVCDGTVLVTRLDRITQSDLTEVLAALAPIKLLGLVANGVKSVPSRYANYQSGSVVTPELRRA